MALRRESGDLALALGEDDHGAEAGCADIAERFDQLCHDSAGLGGRLRSTV